MSCLLTCNSGGDVTLRQEDSEYERTIDNSEDAMEQTPNVINELSTAVTEVAGNAGMLQFLGCQG